jgi:hypothetical protein
MDSACDGVDILIIMFFCFCYILYVKGYTSLIIECLYFMVESDTFRVD